MVRWKLRGHTKNLSHRAGAILSCSSCRLPATDKMIRTLSPAVISAKRSSHLRAVRRLQRESETSPFVCGSSRRRRGRLTLHQPTESPYLRGMLARRIRTDGFVDPCIPSRAAKPPSGPDWVHEVKHDGYRLIVRRDGPAVVRLFTRRGYDWTDLYPAIANAAAKLRAKSFTLDGEAVVCGADGVALFEVLHRRVTEAILPAHRPGSSHDS
jgi:ATP dependent DNA ligase domain